jgi:outer membrane usher protein
VIPYLNPYRINRITVNTRSLPDGVDVKNPVLEIVPTRGAVVAAKFDAKTGHQAAFTLTDRDGKAIPMGAVVENGEGQELGIVGMDGMAFVSGLPALAGEFSVKWGEGSQCRVNYTLPVKTSETAYPQIEAECVTESN